MINFIIFISKIPTFPLNKVFFVKIFSSTMNYFEVLNNKQDQLNQNLKKIIDLDID